MFKVIRDSSFYKETFARLPRWVRKCRCHWKIAPILGISAVLSLVISILWNWLTSSKGVMPADFPTRLIIAQLLITILCGCCWLFVALLAKVLSQWSTHPVAPLSPAHLNRTRMLCRLRRSYDEILAEALQAVAYLELGLSHQPDAVQNTATFLLRLPHRTGRVLPPGTSIIQVYDKALSELLIL